LPNHDLLKEQEPNMSKGTAASVLGLTVLLAMNIEPLYGG
jgi:hypothetical protein